MAATYSRKPHTEKTKEKIRQAIYRRKAKFGYINSPETRKKMSESGKGRISPHKGKKMSEEFKMKVSKGRKGITAWNKGLTKYTDDRVLKNAIAKLGVKRPDISGRKNPNWTGDNESHFGRRFHYQARKVIERHYKMFWNNMCLPHDPIIHHIDRNFRNNNFDNLCVMNRAEHTKLHWGRFD